MEIDYLKEFIILAEVQNYLEASERLFIAQSTLSRHIKLLEDSLNQKLIDISTKKLKLTPYGELLLPYARQICSLDNSYRADASRLAFLEKNVLHIHFLPSAVSYNLVELLGIFQKKHPEITLHMKDMESRLVLESVKNKSCDFGILRDLSSENLIQHTLFYDHAVIVVSAGHALAGRKSVTLDELCQYKLIMPAKDSYLYLLYMAAFEKNNLKPRIHSCVDRGQNMIAFLNFEHCAAIMMKKPALHYANSQVAIVDITPPVSSSIYLSFRPKARLNWAQSCFLSFMQDYIIPHTAED